MWNSIAYFETLTNSLKLTKGKFVPKRVSGISNLEGIIADRENDKFTAVDDTDDGYTFQGAGGGWFKRRTVIVFILQKYDIKNMIDRETKLNECRTIMNRFQSKIIADAQELEELLYFDKTRMPHYEIDEYFANGCTGLYFMISFNEPTDLIYDASEWN